mmetsp:Transcript_7196/g.10512  ORF Transcript_7196/g.10512 Transcript_7196/m.10512 type:complete len:541 (-) Transcript_7196:102-1724(-)
MSGVAGRTNYQTWEKKTSALLDLVDKDEEREKEEARKALGLDGKYAHSQAEAEERQKALDVQRTKDVLDNYREREGTIMQTFRDIFHNKDCEPGKELDSAIARLTRDNLDAGKRVVTICDSKGSSGSDTIVLTQDLSLLESKMNSSGSHEKKYEDNAENSVQEQQQQRTIYGLIKLFISNVHNCTIIIRCKIITGFVELSHCTNVVIRVEKEATVATLQVDLCEQISIKFFDASSGMNSYPPGHKKIFWGENKDDRIFHAGVKEMKISIYRDGFMETECGCDYIEDGAEVIGNASKEEFQFVTSVVDGSLRTERVIRHGSSTGKNVRAMTQREIELETKKREEAAKMAIAKAEDMIKITSKDGKEIVKKCNFEESAKEGDHIEELYTFMSKSEIDSIIADCEQNKLRGNEAFGSGEYAQAVLLYTLALDKADELPDQSDIGGTLLFPRHIVLSNRSASFLKLGDHQKALDDARSAERLDPTYVKGVFRRGLALHAMGRYQEAIEALAAAHKIEPKNKQIKQALQFAEVRMTQEMRKRMDK